MLGTCAVPSITTFLARGTCRANASERATISGRSNAPTTTRVGNLYLAQPLRGGRIRGAFLAQPGRLAPEGDEVHLPDEVAYRGAYLLRTTVGPVHPDPDLQLGDTLQVACLVRGDQLVPLLRGRLVGLGPAHRRADQNHGTDTFRVPESEVDGGRAAHRAADEARALDAEAVEQAPQVFVVGVGDIGQGRPAETLLS